MNQFFEWIAKAFSSWKFWVVIPPWDVSVRVRLGRSATSLSPGPHFRIPFIDHIVLVNTRLRISAVSPVTISTDSDPSRCIRAVIGYRISDPLVAIMEFEWPDQAIQGFTQAAMATGQTAEGVKEELEQRFQGTGVAVEYVQFTEDVKVPTLRLLQGESYISSNYSEEPSDVNSSRY